MRPATGERTGTGPMRPRGSFAITLSPMILPVVNIPVSSAMTCCAPSSIELPWFRALERAAPLRTMAPAFGPKVSMTRSQSSPATRPGPKAIVSSARLLIGPRRSPGALASTITSQAHRSTSPKVWTNTGINVRLRSPMRKSELSIRAPGRDAIQHRCPIVPGIGKSHFSPQCRWRRGLVDRHGIVRP